MIENILYILENYTKPLNTPIIDLLKTQTEDPFKILVGTILSARTQDQTTAKALKKLFLHVNTANDFLSLSISEIESLIYPVGFYRQKALYLKELPIVLNKNFNGKIPEEIDDLLKIPGVGRKTANLVMIQAFNKPAMCVDVHVHRISNRIGYINTKTPLLSEMELRKKLPIQYWKKYNTILVSFGQHICKPINPKCNICPINKYCASCKY